MTKQKKQKTARCRKQNTAGREKSCKHQWATLVAQRGKKVAPVPAAKICLKCGDLKIGQNTIKMSVTRLSIEGGTKLKIPVGTDLYG